MNRKAFSLIELLVVIAIIGILTGLIFVLTNGATNAANDARRKSDISTLYTGILSKGTLSGSYPNLATDIAPGAVPSTLQDYILAYIGRVPADPIGFQLLEVVLYHLVRNS